MCEALLAVDAGGTSTRAVLVEPDGTCLGFGRSASGNPTSGGLDRAAEAVVAAARQALGGRRAVALLVAHAGASTPEYRAAIAARLAPLGLDGPITAAGDVAALFASGTSRGDGVALVAGTGAIAGAMRNGEIDRLVDGTGWLLGDGGSGFAVGRRIARAVTDDLDGGPATLLTPAVLETYGIAEDRTIEHGRVRALSALVHRVYEERPVALARFSPLAFALADRDGVADSIVAEAVAALALLLERVRLLQPDGPLVLGGSVLVRGVLRLPAEVRAPLTSAAGAEQPVPVEDGLVGAAVLALRGAGVTVGPDLHALLSASVAERRTGSAA